MFLGRYYHSLEAKGRLAIPAPFRRLLGTKSVLTRGLDGCLLLLPPNSFKILIADLHPSPLSHKETRTLTRLLSHDALEVNYDSQGRILISQDLRQFAHLENQVVIAGSLDWVEIWDKALYHQHLKNSAQFMDQIAQRWQFLNQAKHD